MLFKPLGLEHIALQVKDQAVAQKFYTEMLGCTIDRVNPEVPLIQMRFGDHQIDLLPGTGSGAAKDGIHHFCLSIKCDDLNALAADLAAKGARLEGDIAPRHGAYGKSPSLYLVDPDGYVIELKPR